MTKNELSSLALEEGKGIFRLTPTWVPRSFCRPGKRIKLHPSDYYALGTAHGGIDERWFASTTHAENGPGTPEDEGLSYIILDDGEKVLLKEAVDELKGQVIGDVLWNKYHGWAMFSKFFDNLGPLPHHIHHRDQHASVNLDPIAPRGMATIEACRKARPKLGRAAAPGDHQYCQRRSGLGGGERSDRG
jgi:hypothetical protein